LAHTALGLAFAVGGQALQASAAAPVVEEAADPSVDSSEGSAADVASAPTPAKPEIAQGASNEVIQERYPNRTVKIERQVTQDSEGNYINHGSWMMWDEKGRMIGAGEFKNGERNGTWTRWYGANEGEMFAGPAFKAFQGPFISEANFADGKLHGVWTVYDSRKRKVTEWEFDHGERNGKSVTYGANGNKLSEVTFRNGQLDGDALEWDAAGKQTAKDTYINGRKLGPKTEFYTTGGAKKTEGVYLFARQTSNYTYDWWNATIKTQSAAKEGKDQRHGMWSSWYQNGQKQLEGKYVEDVPTGKFTWWHENGQKAIEGEYINGKQNGHWVWWHQNGQKSIQGDYVNGSPSSKWTWWREDGRVTKVADMSVDRPKIDETPTVPDVVELQKDSSGPTLQAIPQTQPQIRFQR
jgi:antitoxin component YwqK of YwqJK toxin-antitoxin module